MCINDDDENDDYSDYYYYSLFYFTTCIRDRTRDNEGPLKIVVFTTNILNIKLVPYRALLNY